MAKHSAVDNSILEAALIGLEQQKSQIDAKMAEIRRRLRTGGAAAKSEAAAPAARAKRVLSPAARKRIAEATKKRWALYRAQKATQGGKKAARKVARKKRSTASQAAPATT
jgi:hypothetical protein